MMSAEHPETFSARRRMTVGFFAFAAMVMSIVLAPAAQAQAPSRAPRRACTMRPGLAVEEVLGLNLAVNRFDAWVAREEWARSDFESWARNFRLGWEWDENNFTLNMIMHPLHGSQYFNAGRSNCLTYWESVPLAFFGSWVWEFFGETHRPSLNDFFMTSFGGIALGEMTTRVTATIRDNRATGAGRFAREGVALLLDPIGGINRLFRGQWTRLGPDPKEDDLDAFVFRLSLGVQAASTHIDNVTRPPEWSPTFLLDLNYGDVFERPFQEPFDVFAVRAEIRGTAPLVNLLRASGRVYQVSLGRSTKVVFNHHYEYVNTPSHQFGWQSVEMGVVKRWDIARGYSFQSTLSGDAAFLGAIDAPYAGVGERTYDFGPGVGATFRLALVRQGVTYLSWHNRGAFMHSVSGAAANHLLLLSGFEATIPITRGVGLGFYLSGDRRNSRYEGTAETTRLYTEARLFLTVTSARRPPPQGGR